MRYKKTPLEGSFLIDLEKREDERGFFSRVFCEEEFEKNGLENKFVQANTSWSQEERTLRGLHYQLPPFQEVKLVRCVKGALWDVIVDLRKGSKTFGKWFGALLTDLNRTMLYVPKGFAHGFITLQEGTEMFYLVSAPYSKEHEVGIRYDDPAFSIDWPAPPKVISEKDKIHPPFIL